MAVLISPKSLLNYSDQKSRLSINARLLNYYDTAEKKSHLRIGSLISKKWGNLSLDLDDEDIGRKLRNRGGRFSNAYRIIDSSSSSSSNVVSKTTEKRGCVVKCTAEGIERALVVGGGGGGRNQELKSCRKFMVPERFKVVALMACIMSLCNADRVVMSVAVVPLAEKYGWSSSFLGIVQVISRFFNSYTLIPLFFFFLGFNLLPLNLAGRFLCFLFCFSGFCFLCFQDYKRGKLFLFSVDR